MIGLPGILSQGGKVYTWRRYSIAYVEHIEESVKAEYAADKFAYFLHGYAIDGNLFAAPDGWATGRVRNLVQGETFTFQRPPASTLYKCVYSLQNGANYAVTHDVHTLVGSAGSLIDTVQDSNINAYPDNGIQDGYWYVLTSGDVEPDEPDVPGNNVNYKNYLQSDGAAYINTNFVPDSNTRVVFEFEPAGTYTHLFGSRSASAASDHFRVLVENGKYRDDYGSEKTTSTISAGTRHIIDKNKNITTIDGQTITHASASFDGTYPIALFTNNSGGSVETVSKIRVYPCKIYDNGVLVRYYKPCLDTDGVACMYDEVNGEYVYNAGPGSFIAG